MLSPDLLHAAIGLDFVVELLVQHGGYLGIVLFLVLTGCGLPIPEEVAIVLAGVLSAQQKLLTWPAFSACLVGAILGDCVMYAIGYHWGHGLLITYPRFAKLLRADREEHFEKAIVRHGLKVLLLARFLVGIRAPVYLAAGVVRMPFRKFLVYDLLCATLVVSTFFGLSYAYGEHVFYLLYNAERLLTIVVITVLTIVGIYLYLRHGRNFIRTIIENGGPSGEK